MRSRGMVEQVLLTERVTKGYLMRRLWSRNLDGDSPPTSGDGCVSITS
jgi:hypothetical protein